MNAIKLCQLLLHTDLCLIHEIAVEGHRVYLTLESTANYAKCPECAGISASLHSTYMRCPKGLGWAECPVTLQIRVKSYFCLKPECSKITFAERFPGFVAIYARRTDRLLKKQQCVGVNVCARIAQLLLAFDQVGISDTSINRLLLNLPQPPSRPIRVLGVDDWAKRKGQ